MQLSDCEDSQSYAQMQQLTVEAAALVFCLKLYNPDAQNAFVNGKMDEGRPLTEGPGPTMYSMLLVSTPTESGCRGCNALATQRHCAKLCDCSSICMMTSSRSCRSYLYYAGVVK